MSNIFLTTYQYRIKDSNEALVRFLLSISGKTNYLWNFINNSQKQVVKRNAAGYPYRSWLNKSDVQSLTKGSSNLINLPAQTIQAIQEEYIIRRTQFNKPYLKNRTNKHNRNLPWIPFKTQDIKVDHKGTFTFMGHKIKTWYSSYIPTNAKITNGSLTRDNLGHWFINITFKKELTEREMLLLTSPGQNKTGIDIGLNPFLTKCIEMPLEKKELNDINYQPVNYSKDNSKKIVYEEIIPEKFYRKSEAKLAKNQKARKFKIARKISKKIKNQRKDFLHKLSTEMVRDNTHVVMGLVDLKKLINKKSLKGHSKSWSDNGYGMLKSMLKYKAHKHNIEYEEVSEKEIRSTQTCSCCGKKTGPKGLEGLGVSRWVCVDCDTSHNRNENSAYNHLLARKHSQGEAEVDSNKAKACNNPLTASELKLS